MLPFIPSLFSLMRNIILSLLDFLFPHTCRICGATGTVACDACLTQLQPPKPFQYPWITSGWNYHDPSVEKIIRHLKHHPDEPLIKTLITYLGLTRWSNDSSPRELLISEETFEKPMVIPIPLHISRMRERGYNQAEIIARHYASFWEFVLITQVLIKKRKTKKQGTSASRDERFDNVTDAFAVMHEHLIKERIVILVDDVCTTGATLCEARACLLRSGAREVWAFTLAN